MTALAGTASYDVGPSLPPGYTPDPFAPDPSIWPEAPGWLFPAVMTALAVVAVVVMVLLGMWIKSARMDREAREKRAPQQWVDLSKLDKKGRWAEDDEE